MLRLLIPFRSFPVTIEPRFPQALREAHELTDCTSCSLFMISPQSDVLSLEFGTGILC